MLIRGGRLGCYKKNTVILSCLEGPFCFFGRQCLNEKNETFHIFRNKNVINIKKKNVTYLSIIFRDTNSVVGGGVHTVPTGDIHNVNIHSIDTI